MAKIVFVGPAYPYRGGIAEFNHQLARKFIECGDSCMVETFTLQYPSFLFPGKSQYSDSAPVTDIKISRSINSVNPFSWVMAGRKIKNEAPDIIFLRYWTPYLAPALGEVARIAKGKSKVIALVDNAIPHEKKIWDTPLTKFFLKQIDGFVVMSASVEKDLRSLGIGNKPVICSPHPLYDNYGKRVLRSEAVQALKLNENCSYSLFFGLIREYKGLDILLEAWAKFIGTRDNDAEHKLIIAGEFYCDKEPYIKKLESLGIGDSVIMHNFFIPDNMVKHYFSLCDVVIQPYKTATQSGITQIAYNFDTPMIVTDVGGLKEIVEDGVSGIVTQVSPDSVFTAIKRFYDHNLAEQLSSGVRQAKKNYSWDAMREAIIKVCNLL